MVTKGPLYYLLQVPRSVAFVLSDGAAEVLQGDAGEWFVRAADRDPRVALGDKRRLGRILS